MKTLAFIFCLICASAQAQFQFDSAPFMTVTAKPSAPAVTYPGITNGLIVNYGFNNNANDSVGGYNLTLSGSPSYTTGLNSGANGAIALASASTQYGLNTALTNINSFTMIAFIKPTDFADYRCVFCMGESADRNFEMDTRITTGKINVGFTQGTVTYKELQSTGAVSSGVWSMVAGTYDGTTLSIYINGALDSSTASFSGNPDHPTGHFTVGTILVNGSFTPANLANGNIEGALIYNRALSSTEISTVYGNRTALP